MKSPKEIAVEQKLLEHLADYPVCRRLAGIMFDEPELNELQNYCNNVSIRRLGYNDHGPVHMRQVAVNSVKILKLLNKAGIKTSLEKEEYGTFEDSLCAVLAAGMFHDLGMAIGRQNHENMSLVLGQDLLKRILTEVFPGDIRRQVVLRALTLEAVAGHMATRKIHSIEAGTVLIGDGCDMTKGRARISMQLDSTPKIGDIHKYSASSIERIRIREGIAKPVQIHVEMSGEAGFFQIEEVLLPKINSSPASQYIELSAGIEGQEKKCYLV